MNSMFYFCNHLTNIDLSNLNTENVNNMSYMFYNCSSLTKIDLSNFNTEKVTDMNYMFYDCRAVNSINFINLKIEKCIKMNSMFANCVSLADLKIPEKYNDLFSMGFIASNPNILNIEILSDNEKKYKMPLK